MANKDAENCFECFAIRIVFSIREVFQFGFGFKKLVFFFQSFVV